MWLDKESVKKIIPHRYPILLLDEAEILKPGKLIRGAFHIPADMEIFQGHFPAYPVFPGAYTLESIGQAAGVLILSEDRFRGKLPIYYGSERARLIKPVRPGDTLASRVTLVEENPHKNTVTFSGEGFVNGETAAVSTFIIALR
ncbi:MAG: 3-hydroxyacyl-[acyl-carrier-protein] dehydratase FabZ [Peptococcaceae bacterium]|jgi:3-hydroxyacyl-[acyl-carrier-protein] dehydratase|nr:3-hydroxyacyl-[acyl-carrier-protein] dehydratase FabZ [Peptococcaceae bacterium]